jgi:hypothetical protein
VPIVGATYEIDWSYAHHRRVDQGGATQTVTLRIGDATNPLGTNPIVSTHTADPTLWTVQSGTTAIGAGFPTIRMEFNAVAPGGSAGNLIDACSIILRRVTPTPMNFGQQLINGGFESPVQPGGVTFPSAISTFWQTTDPCNCLEYWKAPAPGGVTAFTGSQFVEMNAFINGTLSQTATLETCENVINWFDATTGASIPSAFIVNCPS